MDEFIQSKMGKAEWSAYVKVLTLYGKQGTWMLQNRQNYWTHGNKYLHKKGLASKASHAVIVATLKTNVTPYATIKKDGGRI